MNLWEKNKEALLSFGKGNQKNIGMLFGASFLLCVASYFFIPFFITDIISHTFYSTPWYILGIIVLGGGIVGLMYSLFSFRDIKRAEKRHLLRNVLVMYVVLRIVEALVSGVAGAILVKTTIDLDIAKIWVDRLTAVILGPINAFLLLYFVTKLYDRSLKEVWKHILQVTILCYGIQVTHLLLENLGASSFDLGVRTVFMSSMVTATIAFVIYLIEKEKSNEEY